MGFVIVPIIVAYIGADAFEYARGTCERAVLVCVRRPCVTNTSRCVIMLTKLKVLIDRLG